MPTDPEVARSRRLELQYGITSADYDRILEEQGGECAFEGCSRTTADKNGRRLNVDHDHQTGETRGLLCAYHNRMLSGPVERWAAAIAAYIADPPARRALGRIVLGRTGRVHKRRRRTRGDSARSA